MAAVSTMDEVGDRSIAFNENLDNAILANLRNQRNESKFCDITLHIDGKKLLAHRSVLAASSPYFESILKNHRITKEDFSISWHDVDSFETLLNYMYSGEVLITFDNVHNLLRLASHFLVNKLKSYCEMFLQRFLDTDNCLFARDMADRYALETLNELVTTFVGDNINEILVKPGITELSARKIEGFITDPTTGCDTVPLPSLLSAIAMWAKRDVAKRAAGFQKLLDVINWKDNDPDEIFGHIEQDSLYQESKFCLFLILRTLVANDVDIGRYAEDYEEMRTEFEDSDMLSQVLQDQSDMILAGDVDEEPQQDGEAPSDDPILVEPVDDQPAKRGRTRRAVAKKPEPVQEITTRSTRRGRSAAAAAEPEPEPEPEQEPVEETRSRRRIVKPKFSGDEWITRSAPPTKKSRPNESRSKKELDASEPEDHVMFDDDDSKANDSTYDKDEENNNENIENSDDNSNKKREPRVRITANFATLQQWREGVKCPHCIYVGHSATRLEQHLARVHEEDQTYKCKMCSFQCKWNREYYKHMKDHYGGPPYKCEDCEYTCDRIQFILSHRMRHTDERPFSCELCSFRSRTKGNLIVHMRIHTGEKPYRCQHCGRCFAMKNTLDQHLATHRDDRPFLCDTCGFTTKYQSHLLSHKRIHTGNVFHCEQEGCTYFSPRRSQLAAHMRSHLSIRSHICSTCGRGFIEKSHLIRHERIHLDEKPFKCEQCDYGSTRRDKLKEHVLKHHSEGQPKPPYKPRKPRSNRSTAAMNQLTTEELGSQIILGSDSQEIQISQASQMSEQDLATANLIYEYAATSDGQPITIGNARVVIQPMGEFGEGQTIVVEQAKEEGEESEDGQVVVYEASTDANGTATRNRDQSGLNAFMAFIN